MKRSHVLKFSTFLRIYVKYVQREDVTIVFCVKHLGVVLWLWAVKFIVLEIFYATSFCKSNPYRAHLKYFSPDCTPAKQL